MAVAVGGYFFGICLALGGALSGPSLGWQADLIGIAQYGLLAIVLMLVAGVLCERVLLPHFNNRKEVVEDQNMGTAFVEAGMHIANGLIVLAIVQGEGPLWSGVAFWLLAQVVLVVAGLLYEWITPHSVHSELERDNAAVGLAFGGVLVGMGNIVSIAVAGDYAGWLIGLKTFGMDAVFGFVALYLIHKLTDVLLAPKVRLGCRASRGTAECGGRADRGLRLRGWIDPNRLDFLNYPVGSAAIATAGLGRRRGYRSESLKHGSTWRRPKQWQGAPCRGGVGLHRRGGDTNRSPQVSERSLLWTIWP